MRPITTHHDGHGLLEKIELLADDPGPGGASHLYQITIPTNWDANRNQYLGRRIHTLQFQKGPRDEVGSEAGVVERVLTAILIDRLESFQAGPFRCGENDEALDALHRAHALFKERTDNRAKRGVLGTSAP